MRFPGGGTSMMLLENARMHLVVEAGQTAVVEGPDGRAVVGRVALPDDPDFATRWLPVVELSSRLAAPDFPHPNPDPSLSDSAKLKALQDWKATVLAYWLSNEGKASRRAECRFKTHADPDGSFRLDHVPPGDYSLVIYNASPAGGGIRNSIVTSRSPPQAMEPQLSWGCLTYLLRTRIQRWDNSTVQPICRSELIQRAHHRLFRFHGIIRWSLEGGKRLREE